MSDYNIDVTVDDGKYRIIQHRTGGVEILRHGEPWMGGPAGSFPGVNVVIAMACELEELRAKVGKLNEEQYLLICLAEECAEVTQRVCKQLRFTSTEVQSGQGLDNAERTAVELDDLLGVHGKLIETDNLRGPDSGAVIAKFAKIERFMDYSRQQGVLG